MLSHHQGFDHVYTQVPDIDAAMSSLRALGFCMTSKDYTEAEGLDVTSVVFPNTWLAFGAPRTSPFTEATKRALLQEGLTKTWDAAAPDERTALNNLGPMASLIVSMTDPDAFLKSLSDSGLEGMGPRLFRRLTQTPGGPKDLAMKMVMANKNLDETLADGFGAGGVNLFGLSVGAPEAFRRSDTLTHENTATNIRYVVFATADPAAFVRRLTAAFGGNAVDQTDGALRLSLPPVEIWFATPNTLREKFDLDAASVVGPHPQIAAIGVSVQDIDMATALLEKNGLAFERNVNEAIRTRLTSLADLTLDFVV